MVPYTRAPSTPHHEKLSMPTEERPLRASYEGHQRNKVTVTASSSKLPLLDSATLFNAIGILLNRDICAVRRSRLLDACSTLPVKYSLTNCLICTILPLAHGT